MSIVSELVDSRELVLNLVRREVKGKYKATALGQLWSLANPLTAMVIYTVVFAFIIRIQPEPGDPSGVDVFAVWLLCALLPWTFFTNVANGGMIAFVGNENLVKKVYFPRIALVVSNSIAWLYTWAIEMLVLLVVLLVIGANPLPWIPLVLVAMVFMWLFTTGISMMLSIANVYFRDTHHIMTVVLQLMFYLTPIVYPVSLVTEQSDRIGPLFGSVTVLDLYQLNPIGHFVEVFRNLLYDNRWPDLSTSMACVAWGVGTFAVGYWVFKRHEKGLAEAL